MIIRSGDLEPRCIGVRAPALVYRRMIIRSGVPVYRRMITRSGDLERRCIGVRAPARVYRRMIIRSGDLERRRSYPILEIKGTSNLKAETPETQTYHRA